MSSSSTHIIYTGFWTDWARGRVQGSTLTLSAENSVFLVAFIALFVRFVGGQLWAVLAFVTSVTRSTAEPRDALYHQQQAILRNTSQPASVVWAMIKLSWFWKGVAKGAKIRTFAFIFNGLAFIAAFAVAGIFSSKITTLNSAVLMLPTPLCGPWYYPYIQFWTPAERSWSDYNTEWAQYAINYDQLVKRSHIYVAECYNSTLNTPAEFCLPFGRSRISWSTNLEAKCPFDDNMCIADAVEFDTGFLNSGTHLGINTKDGHVEYRRVMTCAPITTEGYESDWVNVDSLNYSDTSLAGIEGENFLKYAYGQNVLMNDNNGTTFAYNNYSWLYSAGYNIPYRSYDLDVEFSVAAPDDPELIFEPTFTAITSLSRSDADTTLVFLSQDNSYLSPVNDPWFLATDYNQVEQQAIDGSTWEVAQYTSNALVTVMGCTEQHQLRNPITGATSPLGGEEIITHRQAMSLDFNENQMAVFNRSFALGGFSILPYVVPALGGSYLLAASSTVNTQAVALADNQWQMECEHWFGVALNAVQLLSQQYVTGPLQASMNQYITPATEGFMQEMCSNQIIRRADYRSFSVLGLSIIFSFGFFFIIANLTVTPIVQAVQKKTEKGRYQNAEWQADDVLQLQRMAYQHNNVGTWTGQHDMVPRTSPGEIFTIPESTNWSQVTPEHPDESGTPYRSWSRRWRFRNGTPQSPVTKTADVSLNEKQPTTAVHVEKTVEISENEITRKE